MLHPTAVWWLGKHSDGAAGRARDGRGACRKACIWIGEVTESHAIANDAPTQAIYAYTGVWRGKLHALITIISC